MILRKLWFYWLEVDGSIKGVEVNDKTKFWIDNKLSKLDATFWITCRDFSTGAQLAKENFVDKYLSKEWS